MSLGECMDEIHCRWESADIRRRDPALPVWDLGRPGLFARHRRQRREAVAACRQEVLATLLRWSGLVFLMHPEPPKEYKVPGNWRHAGEATWLVPPDFDPEEAGGKLWLSLGDWRFYSGPESVQGMWPDVFRCHAAQLLAWMSARPVRVLVESFHDDTDWVVALGAAQLIAAPDRGGR
jgi:hypothetical protein